MQRPSGFESRHLSKARNERHKQRSAQHTLALKKKIAKITLYASFWTNSSPQMYRYVGVNWGQEFSRLGLQKTAFSLPYDEIAVFSWAKFGTKKVASAITFTGKWRLPSPHTRHSSNALSLTFWPNQKSVHATYSLKVLSSEMDQAESRLIR